jgi:hypothetical protein
MFFLGDFRICADNSDSIFTKKLIQLTVRTYNLDDIITNNKGKKELHTSQKNLKVVKFFIRVNLLIVISFTNIKESSSKIFKNMLNVSIYQQELKNRESRDEYLILSNHASVLLYSFIETIIIIICAFFQNIYIKILFK